VLAQQVAIGFVGQFLERLHRVARQQVERLPRLLVEFHELAPDIGTTLGHDTSYVPPEQRPARRIVHP
jgi:hypothetical protein